MKITFWVEGSKQPLEQYVVAGEVGDWEVIINELHMGTFSPDFVCLFDEDTGIAHYVRTDAIDVIKVEW